jgi:lariat debranching enzyme
MSHDWPTGIHRYGDEEGLLRRKAHFREDIERDELGSRPAEMLLRRLRPWYWFSAHLHVKFAAFVDHDAVEGGSSVEGSGQGMGGQVQETGDDEGEILLDDSDAENENPSSPGKRTLSLSASESSPKRLKQTSGSNSNQSSNQSSEMLSQGKDITKTGRTTRFLALDKCLPHRDFLQILDIAPDPTVPCSDHLSYSPEWLAITRTFHPYLSTALKPIPMPSDEQLRMYIPLDPFPSLVNSPFLLVRVNTLSLLYG